MLYLMRRLKKKKRKYGIRSSPFENLSTVRSVIFNLDHEMYSLNFISNGEDPLSESRDGKDSNEYVSKNQRLK
jgi:hypothetical protein